MTRKKSTPQEKIQKIISIYFGKTEAATIGVLLEKNGKTITAEEIAETIGLPSQFVYRALYNLADNNIVYNIVPIHRLESDKKYYWKATTEHVLKALKGYFNTKKAKAENLFESLQEDFEGSFYCKDINSLFDFSWAEIYSFVCPLSGKYMVQYDFDNERQALENKLKEISSMKRKITYIEKVSGV